jgi:hypothetical protein
MKTTIKGTPGFGAGLLIALVAALVLALQARHAVIVVQKGAKPVELRTETASAPGKVLIAQLARKDALLASASVTSRDPFRDPPPPPPRPGAARPVPAPARPVIPPVLRGLAFDNSGEGTIKLSDSEEESGWLHKGEEFQGWRIIEIKPTGATISRGGVNTVLNNVPHSG